MDVDSSAGSNTCISINDSGQARTGSEREILGLASANAFQREHDKKLFPRFDLKYLRRHDSLNDFTCRPSQILFQSYNALPHTKADSSCELAFCSINIPTWAAF